MADNRIVLDLLPPDKQMVTGHIPYQGGQAKQKNMCVSGYMLLKIRVGRSDYFFNFRNNFICLKYFS